MSWLQRLVETYDACLGADQFEQDPLPPISHTLQQAHIEIVIDGRGQFLEAKTLETDQETLIPVTEDSEGRTSGIAPHPLCDKIQYIAADYLRHGGLKQKDEPTPPKSTKGKAYRDFLEKHKNWQSDPSFHPDYLNVLTAWCESTNSHVKAKAILDYVKKGTVVADLVKDKLLIVDENGKLITKKQNGKSKSKIFQVLGNEPDQGGALVRWRVQIQHDPEYKVWKDLSLQDSWVRFYATQINKMHLCMISGEEELCATNHPRSLRYSGDSAKLITANDKTGYTFRGRFTDSDQACSIGYTGSQKAHIALRWLVRRRRQAFIKGELAVIAWAVAGEEIPDPYDNPFAAVQSVATAYHGDAGQSYAEALKLKIAGYRTNLSASSNIVVMVLDSATKGRLAIKFYREFGADEFLQRIENWHESFAWEQNYGGKRFVGAPTPRDIAMIAYPSTDSGSNMQRKQKAQEPSEEIEGNRKDTSITKLRKACIERLLPCMLDNRPFPRDLVDVVVNRVSNRITMKTKESDIGGAWGRWNRALGIACALYRGYHKGEDFRMALEYERTSRDYLYGRLLAVADKLEERALELTDKPRETTAARLMQRFANHPYPTWRNIELALQPYRAQLRSRDPDYLGRLDGCLNQICSLFAPEDFQSPEKLKGEFLLGYHCQRAKLFTPKPDKASDTSN